MWTPIFNLTWLMPLKTMRFTVILDPEEDGGYSAYCPAFPGCVSQGEDRQDALKNIEEAVLLMLEVLEAEQSAAVPVSGNRGWPPKETPDVVAEEIREVLKFRHEDGRPLTIETVQVEVSTPVVA